jgi:murein DD-endopeptidase MepM/ murein hydrolase activator NlpD
MFKKVLIILFLLPIVGFSQSGKIQLIEQVVTTAKSYDDIKNVIDIIKKYPAIYTYIPSFCPVTEKYYISSNYGMRLHPILKQNIFHSGIDMAAEYAAKIHAAADGTVSFAGDKGTYGKMIEVTHKYGFTTRYGHLTYIYAKLNQIIKKGDVIGFVGSTGRSTGDHLHFEIIKNKNKINPIQFRSCFEFFN